jgi:hypothetical protein
MAMAGDKRRRGGSLLLAGLIGLILGAMAVLALARSGGDRDRAYVTVERMTLPIVNDRDHVDRYIVIDFALEVPAERRVFVRQRLPEVRHAVNEAAWRTRLTEDGTGRLEVERIRTLLLQAARRALGPGAVEQVRILSAEPT